MVEHPVVELVIVPRSAEIQAAEDALSLALVAMNGGARPPVTLAMVREHIRRCFLIDDADMSVLRHAPEDFIVRFSHREDLEWVLHVPPPEGASPFFLTHYWKLDFCCVPYIFSVGCTKTHSKNIIYPVGSPNSQGNTYNPVGLSHTHREISSQDNYLQFPVSYAIYLSHMYTG